MNLSIRLAAAAATATASLLLSACGGAAGPAPPARAAAAAPASAGPAAPASTGPVTSAPVPNPAPAPAPAPFGYQPLFPFAGPAQVQAWQAAFASGGHQPWHLSARQTALAFTAFLGFTGVTRVAGQTGTAADAHVAVGITLPNGRIAVAAVVHLVRYGSGRSVPWEVVGTDDTTLTLAAPAYGTDVASPVTIGGKITGVDESLRANVHALGSASTVGRYCCRPAGGQRTPWSFSVPFRAPSGTVITIVVHTGGHVAAVERFAVTGVRVR